MRVRIPLARKVLSNYFFYKNFKNILNLPYDPIYYSFSFISLIPPFFVSKSAAGRLFKNKNKKILVKQSYMLLVWFYYLSFFKKTDKDNFKIKIATLPYRQRSFTLTKAPIAHKTRSKEQYRYGFYSFKITFQSFLKKSINNPLTINSTLFFILLNRKQLPFFETSVFFLKATQLNLLLYDQSFFNYHKFEKINKF